MKTFIAIIIILHGLIHLFGFLKAFNLAEFKELKLPINKLWGIIWLVAFFLLTIATILLLLNNQYWQHLAIVGLIVSQILIFKFWSDAKFGTLSNIIILAAILFV